MLICDENKCTGCGACVNLCPTDSIKMKENIYGEIHPEINEQKCVECKKMCTIMSVKFKSSVK